MHASHTFFPIFASLVVVKKWLDPMHEGGAVRVDSGQRTR